MTTTTLDFPPNATLHLESYVWLDKMEHSK